MKCPECQRPMRYLKDVTVKVAEDKFKALPVYDCSEHGLWRRDEDGGFRPHPLLI